MKNVHILPKKSFNQIGFDHYGKTPTQIKIATFLITKNIYITSNVEIKPNVYALINGVLCKTELLGGRIVSRQLTGGGTMDICKSEYSEIILTTDPDLIFVGVQAIDDTFLEWFVKNPSCEKVETKLVEFEVDMGLGESCIEYGSYYKIIIPNEEPNQIKCYCGHTTYCDCSPIDEAKQETLEEDKLRQLFKNRSNCYADSDDVVQAMDENCFIETLKEWQLKEEQKQHLIDMMKDDENLKLYKNWVEDAEKESSLSDLNSKANIFWSGFRVGVKSKQETLEATCRKIRK